MTLPISESVAQKTVMPATPLPNSSVTRTLIGSGSAWPGDPCCPSPDAIASVVAGPAPLFALIVTGPPMSPGNVAVSVCTPGAPPSVHSVATNPSSSETAVSSERLPPPVATVNVTVTPETGTSSDASTRSMMSFSSVCPAFPLWPLPLTISSCVAGSATVIVTVSASTPVGSVATMRAGPRTGSHVATPSGVMLTCAGSGLENTTGVFAIGWPCPSSADALNVVDVPDRTVPGCCEMTTVWAFAPVPT